MTSLPDSRLRGRTPKRIRRRCWRFGAVVVNLGKILAEAKQQSWSIILEQALERVNGRFAERALIEISDREYMAVWKRLSVDKGACILRVVSTLPGAVAVLWVEDNRKAEGYPWGLFGSQWASLNRPPSLLSPPSASTHRFPVDLHVTHPLVPSLCVLLWFLLLLCQALSLPRDFIGFQQDPSRSI